MNSVDALARYLQLAARTLRRYTCLRGASILIGAALALTFALAAWITRFPASPASLWWCRVALFTGLVAVIAAAFAIPLLRLNTAAAARILERRFPAFGQHLITFMDRRLQHPPDPFLPLLAETALQLARTAEPDGLIPLRSRILFAGSGLAAGLVLIALITGESGPVSRNAAALWMGKDVFRVELKAPRHTIRRGGWLTVTARIIGFTAHNANLWTRYDKSRAWQSTPMLASPDQALFALELSGIARNIEYYAESQGVRSPTAHLNVVDLPAVTNIRVTYPKQSPLARALNGDIVAPAGTIANLEVETDRAMAGAQLTLEQADPIALPRTTENRTFASLRVLRDDAYHVSVKYDGEDVPVSGEHAIEVLTGADTTRTSGPPLLRGARIGPVPHGYERSVSEYYRRLGDQQNARR